VTINGTPLLFLLLCASTILPVKRSMGFGDRYIIEISPASTIALLLQGQLIAFDNYKCRANLQQKIRY
jgi:hypothetical protein